jgi:hypothetical protein
MFNQLKLTIMTYKELRELCITTEEKDRAGNYFIPYYAEYKDTTFDEVATEVKEHGKHYYSAMTELNSRMITTFADYLYNISPELLEPDENDEYDRVLAGWLQCVDAECGTNLYWMVYDSDVEQYIKERHANEEWERQEQERYELREFVCHIAARDMDITLEEAYDTFDFLY